LLQTKQAQRGERCIALAMVDPSATRESVVSATPWLLYLQQRDPVPIFQEGGWTSVQVCMGPENLALSGFKPQTIQPISSNYTNYTIQAVIGM